MNTGKTDEIRHDGVNHEQRLGIGTDKPEALLDIRSEKGTYDPMRRKWPAPSQVHISPARDEIAGAYLGSKTENHFYAAAGIRRRGQGEWEVLSDLGAGLTSTLDGGHNFFCIPPGMAGKVINPSEWIRVRIAADGNVGIGTTTPTERLDVRGAVRCDDLRCPESAFREPGAIEPHADPASSKTISLLEAFASLSRAVKRMEREIKDLKDSMAHGKEE